MRIIQLVPTLAFGDAVGNDAIAIAKLIKKMGHETKIFAQYIDNKITSDVVADFNSMPELNEDDLIIYHFCTVSDSMEALLEQTRCRKIMVYHNVTPSTFFKEYDENLASIVQRSRESLKKLNNVFERCIAVSEFNKKDLVQNGYTCPIDVVPILIPLHDYEKNPNEDVLNKYANDGWVNWLFVGRVVPNKKHEDIIKAFAYYKKYLNAKSRLFIVGTYAGMDKYYDKLCHYIKELHTQDIIFTGKTSFDQILAYYKLADVFVCMSEHEGFCVPLVEAMKFDVPVIAFASSAIPETLGGAGILLEDKSSILVSKIVDAIIKNKTLQRKIVEKQEERLKYFSYENVSKEMTEEINDIIKKAKCKVANIQENKWIKHDAVYDAEIKALLYECLKDIKKDALVDDTKEFKLIDNIDDKGKNNTLKHKIKINVLKPIYKQLYMVNPSVADSIRSKIYCLAGKKTAIIQASNVVDRRKPGILVDLTQITRSNAKTGIQRVVDNIFRQITLLDVNAIGVRDLQGDLITDKLYAALEKNEEFKEQEQKINLKQGDKLLLLDSSWEFSDDFSVIVDKVHDNGGTSYGIIYDLLPVQYPELIINDYLKTVYSRWHKMLLKKCNSVICISKTTAHLVEWFYKKEKIQRGTALNVYWFPMGSDIKNDCAIERNDIKEFVDSQNTFLMVGTVEPRKGHMVAAKALHKLLAKGTDAKLIIIGKDGWKNDEIKMVMEDNEIKNNVKWIKDATDGELQWCYKHCAALIAASKDEGFGLPIIEAAHYGLPIICSDIPIFHEVAGNEAVYFKAMDSDDLMNKIEMWLSEEKHPNSANIKLYTWEESAQTLLDIMNNKIEPYIKLK